MTIELDFDADTVQDAFFYFCQRDVQISGPTGWRLRMMRALDSEAPWGVLARFEKDKEKRFAVYVLKSHRGEGKLSAFIAEHQIMNFITVDDCNVAGFYAKHGRDCLVLQTPRA